MKIQNDEPFSDEDLMRLVIYPLTYKGRDAKVKAVHKAIELTDHMYNEMQMREVVAMLAVFVDKFISEEDSEEIRRKLTMSKLERIIEKEKEDAVKDAVKDAVRDTEEKKEKEKVLAIEQIAQKLLSQGDSIRKVSDSTGLSISRVEELAAARA